MPETIHDAVDIIELDPNGHRFEYCRILADFFISLGTDVRIITSRSAISSSAFLCHIAPIKEDLTVLDLVDSYLPKNIFHCLRILNRVASCIRESNANAIYIPDGTTITYFASMLNRFRLYDKSNSQKVKALIMGGLHGYSEQRRSIFKKAIYGFLPFHPWAQLFHLDAFQVEYLKKYVPRISLMPDPIPNFNVTTTIRAREELGLPINDLLIGFPGSIELSKGVDLLIAAFEKSIYSIDPSCKVVLVGEFLTNTKSYILDRFSRLVKDGRVLIIDKFLTKDEMEYAVQALDVVCFPYRRAFQSSGVLLRSIVLRKQILATREGWFGKTLGDLGFGELVDIGDIDDIGRGIKSALRNLEKSEVNEEAIESFVEFHSPQNFCKTWLLS